jgi:hypothetical protein
MRVIPNEECWIGFLPDATPADLCSPTMADIGDCIDLTCFVSSLNAGAQGNTVPTPSLCSLFETSVPGTSAATFTGEFYRDGETTGTPPKPIDLAWNSLPRKAKGCFIIGRFGIPKSATTGDPTPIIGSQVECWPVEITSRGAGPMASGTPLSFTLTAAINVEPCEDAEVIS